MKIAIETWRSIPAHTINVSNHHRLIDSISHYGAALQFQWLCQHFCGNYCNFLEQKYILCVCSSIRHTCHVQQNMLRELHLCFCSLYENLLNSTLLRTKHHYTLYVCTLRNSDVFSSAIHNNMVDWMYRICTSTSTNAGFVVLSISQHLHIRQ